MSNMVLIAALSAFGALVILVLTDAAMRGRAAYARLTREMMRGDELAAVYMKTETPDAPQPVKLPKISAGRTAHSRQQATRTVSCQPKLRVAA